MTPFQFQGSAQRVVFGTGTIDQVPAEVQRLGLGRVLVVSTAGHASRAAQVATALGEVCAGTCTKARMHTPVEVTDDVMQTVDALGIDGTVAVGGGSAIGLTKAIALRTDLPQVVVPTTYAGSEATSTLGETRDGRKKTVRDPRIQPEVIVYDVALTRSLPVPLSVASGLNAMAHAVEGLWAKDANPVSSLLAEEGIRSLGASLVDIARRPHDDEVRSAALYGAWLSGMVLHFTSMALHHRLCHVLGGAFNLSHADTHAILLSHVVAYNAPGASTAVARVARALGTDDAAAGVFAVLTSGGGPRALGDLGMPADGVGRAVDILMQDPPWNPQPVTREGVGALLERAWAGEAPSHQGGRVL